jgi:hypothetical protein
VQIIKVHTPIQILRNPIIIPNEFITTLLDPYSNKELNKINTQITNKVLDTVCPSLNPIINRLLPLTTKKTKVGKCGNPITPTNTILYGSTICQDLLILNASRSRALRRQRGVTNYEIKLLNDTNTVVWPWSIQYNADRLGNNKRLQYFPLIIAFPKSTHEVSFWIKFAQKYNITPCIRSGGHSYEGFSCCNPLIIDTTNLVIKYYQGKEICSKPYIISKSREYVDVAPGVRLGPLYHALDQEGLIITGGICPSVCVGGLVAGGGIGYFLRKFGFACDNLLEADIVLASGQRITCTANNEYSDLFKAIKGAGGGNFGVITRYRLRTYKIRKVIYFTYSFAGSDTVSVLDALQHVGISAPDLLSGIVGNMVAGIDGITVNGIYTPIKTKDPFTEFNLFIQKYFFSLLPSITPTDSNIVYESFVDVDTELGFEAPPLPFYKTRSSYQFELLSRDKLQIIANSIAKAPIGNGPLFFALQILVYGGFVNRVDPNSSVMVARAGTKQWYQMALYYTDPNDIQSVFTYVNNIYNTISSLTSIYADPNAPDMELINPLKSYYGENNIDFLTKVKTKYDPNNVFTFPQSIPVASS